MIYGRGSPMCLPFVGAGATCPYNKINNKEIFLILIYLKIFGETPE
jgi:hypothetical protein